jgi:hypothetical protein
LDPIAEHAVVTDKSVKEPPPAEPLIEASHLQSVKIDKVAQYLLDKSKFLLDATKRDITSAPSKPKKVKRKKKKRVIAVEEYQDGSGKNLSGGFPRPGSECGLFGVGANNLPPLRGDDVGSVGSLGSSTSDAEDINITYPPASAPKSRSEKSSRKSHRRGSSRISKSDGFQDMPKSWKGHRINEFESETNPDCLKQNTQTQWENQIARHILSVYATTKAGDSEKEGRGWLVYVDRKNEDTTTTVEEYLKKPGDLVEQTLRSTQGSAGGGRVSSSLGKRPQLQSVNSMPSFPTIPSKDIPKRDIQSRDIHSRQLASRQAGTPQPGSRQANPSPNANPVAAFDFRDEFAPSDSLHSLSYSEDAFLNGAAASDQGMIRTESRAQDRRVFFSNADETTDESALSSLLSSRKVGEEDAIIEHPTGESEGESGRAESRTGSRSGSRTGSGAQKGLENAAPVADFLDAGAKSDVYVSPDSNASSDFACISFNDIGKASVQRERGEGAGGTEGEEEEYEEDVFESEFSPPKRQQPNRNQKDSNGTSPVGSYDSVEGSIPSNSASPQPSDTPGVVEAFHMEEADSFDMTFPLKSFGPRASFRSSSQGMRPMSQGHMMPQRGHTPHAPQRAHSNSDFDESYDGDEVVRISTANLKSGEGLMGLLEFEPQGDSIGYGSGGNDSDSARGTSAGTRPQSKLKVRVGTTQQGGDSCIVRTSSNISLNASASSSQLASRTRTPHSRLSSAGQTDRLSMSRQTVWTSGSERPITTTSAFANDPRRNLKSSAQTTFKGVKAHDKNGEPVMVRGSPPCSHIWFVSTGEVQLDWSELPGGEKLQATLSMLNEKRRYQDYVNVIEALLSELQLSTNNYMTARRAYLQKTRSSPSERLPAVKHERLRKALNGQNAGGKSSGKGLLQSKSRRESDMPDPMDETVYDSAGRRIYGMPMLHIFWERLVLSANAMGILMIEKKNFKVAYDLLNRAKGWTCNGECLPREAAQRLAAHVFDALGYYYFIRKRIMAALDLTRRSLVIHEKFENLECMAACHLHLAAIQSQLTEFKESHKVRMDHAMMCA